MQTGETIIAERDAVKAERIQISHGRAIRVVSVFPRNGSASPEDKLKALVDLELQRQRLCA